MSHDAIRNTFEAIIETWALTKNLPVSFENIEFDPEIYESFVVSQLSPVITRSLTLYGADHTEYQGIYQVSVVVPVGEGVGRANALAQGIKSLFPIYQPITVDAVPSFKVIPITPVTVMDGVTGKTKYTLPIFFRYRADV